MVQPLNWETDESTERVLNDTWDKDGNFIRTGSMGLDIARGNIPGISFIHKFGEAPDFDTGDGHVTIWDGADDANIDQMVYQYSSTADIDRLSSSNAGDTQDIEIQGLDSNFDQATQTITLTGQTPVALTTSLVRVFRLKNVGSTSNAGHVYCFVNGATTLGVPDTPADVRAIMQPGLNQTLMAVYTIPNGKTGYMDSFYAATSGASKNSPFHVHFLARPTGQVLQLKNAFTILETGTSRTQHFYKVPEIFQAKTDIEMRVEAEAGGTTGARFAGGFDLILVDD